MTRPPRSLFARRAGSEKPRRKWTLRSLLCRVLPLYLLYFVLGATLPFLSPPTVSDSFRAAWDPAVFEQVGSTDRAALVTDNQDALDVRLRMIGEAEERIILSSFDIRDCDSGRDIFAALLLAADRGVQIQILWDGVSGLLRGGSPIFRALGRLPNVEIRFYNAPNLLLPWTVNGRMHDKYLLIDDRLLLLGGRNTFDLFLGDYVPDALKSHDQDVLVYNTAAGTEQSGAHTVLTQVEAYFQSVWESPYSRTALDRPPLFPGKIDRAEAELRTRYAALAAADPTLFDPIPLDYAALTLPVEHVELLSNPTGIMSKEPWVWWQLMALMGRAEERVFLQTPYAVLNEPMYQALEDLAARGVPFDLQLNSVAVGDNIMASSDYVHNKQRLLETGVTVWEWFGDYSSHGKSALIDDMAVVGSYNLDMRSTYLDTELMLVFHGGDFSRALEEYLLSTQDHALQALPQGGYVPKEGVEVLPVIGAKAWLFPITSVVFQLIRYLL